MNAEYTLRALKAGKRVLCEKPMATRVADAQAMIAAAKAADRKLMIAYRCHYDTFNLDVMRRMRSGALGRPRIVATDMGIRALPAILRRLAPQSAGGRRRRPGRHGRLWRERRAVSSRRRAGGGARLGAYGRERPALSHHR